MTKLTNFTLGFALAAMLVGPTAWADARQAVHTGMPVAQVASPPALPFHMLATVRSVLLPKH